MATARSSSVHKWILRLALPNILSNLTVPILGIFDLGMAGHLQYAEEIGAVALGTTLFNLLYWSFGFLRMGTTGLTAQAHGRGNKLEMGRCLLQSGLIGLVIGLLLLILRAPIADVLLHLMVNDGSEQLRHFAEIYFLTGSLGAPAVLLSFALNGFIIGMQNTWWPMIVAISTNVINVGVSAYLVITTDLGVVGIAAGTATAQWIGVLMLGLGAWWLFLRRQKVEINLSRTNLLEGIGRFFSTNVYIFLRTTLLVATHTYFTYFGTQAGAVVLAANALLLQFISLFSYFIDGFAYAAEAIVGHLFGSRQFKELQRHIRYLFAYGAVLALIVSGIYFLFGERILELFTEKLEVIRMAKSYIRWVYLIPVLSFTAYIWDGIYIGLTYVREMLITMAVAVGFYFVLNFWSPLADANTTLWIAFASYLFLRGFMQTILARPYLKNLRREQ